MSELNLFRVAVLDLDLLGMYQIALLIKKRELESAGGGKSVHFFDYLEEFIREAHYVVASRLMLE